MDIEPMYLVLAVVFVVGVVLVFFGKKSDEKMVSSAAQEQDVVVKQPPIESLREMTLKELSQYTGKNNSKVYLACKGIVFDVSSSEFYVGDGGYSAFAGKDCSVNLAKMSFEVSDYNMYGKTELAMSERDILDQWYEKYYQKYQIVAKIQVLDSKKDN